MKIVFSLNQLVSNQKWECLFLSIYYAQMLNPKENAKKLKIIPCWINPSVRKSKNLLQLLIPNEQLIDLKLERSKKLFNLNLIRVGFQSFRFLDREFTGRSIIFCARMLNFFFGYGARTHRFYDKIAVPTKSMIR